jgi:putative ABC transport system substrate-binding protein
LETSSISLTVPISAFAKLQTFSKVQVEDVPPIDIPIRSLSRFSYVVNMETARQLAAYPPLAVLRYAEVVNGAPEARP